MSILRRIERLDAKVGIPRPADAPHLTSYHALLSFSGNVFQMLVCIVCGFGGAWCLWITANHLRITTGWWLILFLGGMLWMVILGFLDAANVLRSYLRINQRITHGSAMWADVQWLKAERFARSSKEKILPGELRLGSLPTAHSLVLPASHTMRHIGIFGPPGSGKSATFLMSFIRDWAKTGSVIVLDPKGELYAQTAAGYKTVYRLDLQDPSFSNPWNFLPHCKGNAEFAHEVASIIIGLDETRHSSDSEKFWQVSEVAALTAILLHLPQVENYPIPAGIIDFIATRELEPNPAKPNAIIMGDEMMQSADPSVRRYWGTFAKAKRELQGNILTGVSVKCDPFTTPHIRRITDCPPGARSTAIELEMLRNPGTAIYVVIPEGDASRYSTFLATFFGLAMSTLRKLPVNQNTPPALFVFDEAGNIPIHGLKEMLGVGRGRKVGIVLGYQNLSQVHSQYGEHGGDAILGSIGTMIFLPGLDDKTSRYASGRVGKTTVLQRTSVDATGTKYDNERQAEHARDLMDHAELRQLVRHTQAVAIIDNVPPVRFSFPPYAIRANATDPVPTLLADTNSEEVSND